MSREGVTYYVDPRYYFVDMDALVSARLLKETPKSSSLDNSATGAGSFTYYVDDKGKVQTLPFDFPRTNGFKVTPTPTPPPPPPPLNLSGNSGVSGDPDVAVSGSNTYVVWHDDTPGNLEVFFSKSTDGGVTFSSPVNLSNAAGTSASARVAVADSNVYVVWNDDNDPGNVEIFFRRSTDGGGTFGSIVNLSNTPCLCGSGSNQPDVAVSGSNVYVSWTDVTSFPSNSEVFFRRSTNGGATFEGPVQLSSTAFYSYNSRIAASGNNVYVVWADNMSDTPPEILSRRSTDNGATFGAVVNISNTSNVSRLPDIAVAGSNVYIVWIETETNRVVKFRKSTDSGANYGSVANLGTVVGADPGILFHPRIATSGNNVYVVWPDNNTPGNKYDIVLRTSADTGATFAGAVNLSNNAGDSILGAIEVSLGKLYVVWDDDSPTNREIFFVGR